MDTTPLGRLTIFATSLIAYIAFLAAMIGTVVFLTGAAKFPDVDQGASTPAPVAVAVDLALLGIFALQHTVMARQGFKRWLTQVVPATSERSLFVLAASFALLLLLWQWRPIPETVWVLHTPLSTILWAVYAAGWLLVVASTFMIDHFDLFGLRQSWLALRGRTYSPPEFQIRWLYARVRHPIMSGFLIAIWATPSMSAGHLLFAAASTAYIGVGVWFEERDLIRSIPAYSAYRQSVGAFVPSLTALWSGRDQAISGPNLARREEGAGRPAHRYLVGRMGLSGLADLQDRAGVGGDRGRDHEHG